MQHKSYNCLKLDNGQFALQPNNRCLFFQPYLNPPELLRPDFKVGAKKWVSESQPKWANSEKDYVPHRVE